MSGYRQMAGVHALIDSMPEVARVLRPERILHPVDPDPPPEWRGPGIWRGGWGPVSATTGRDLVPVSGPVFIWDVNGYYRALDIGWPFRPSKRDLREGYQRVDGAGDEFATYALKRLLDADFRKHYDARPWGHPVDDKYRWLMIKRRAAAWAAEQTLRTGRLHTERDFIGEQIARKMEQAVSGSVDPPRPPEAVSLPDWGYGYFLWGCYRRDEPKLSQWQRMVLAALWERDIRCQVAVGLSGDRPETVTRVRHADNDILFLHEVAEPSEELAAEVADSFLDSPPGTLLESPITFGANPASISEPPGSHLQDAERIFNAPWEGDPMSDRLDFATGGQQAADADKAEKAARRSRWSRTFLTSILQDDGDTVILRFLDDEPAWIETKQHAMVKTKAAPKDKPAERDWQDKMSAVCRYTPVGKGADRRPAYNDCYICDVMTDEKGKKYFPAQRMWVRAAVREPVLGTEEMVKAGQIPAHMVGQAISYRDAADEVDEINEKNEPTGKKRMKKRIVIVNMAQSNFFSPLLTYKGFYQTVVDRDYAVVRKGEKGARKPVYEFAPLNPTHVLHPETGEDVIFDLRDPKLAAVYEGHGMSYEDLANYVQSRCSEEFYHRYFDPRYEVSWLSSDDDDSSPSTEQSAEVAAGQSSVAEPNSGPTKDQVAAMRARLIKDNPPPAGEGATSTVAMPLT